MNSQQGLDQPFEQQLEENKVQEEQSQQPQVLENKASEVTRTQESKIQENGQRENQEILKQGAVKAIIWEDIVAKGYDSMDFSHFLPNFQKENNVVEGNWTQPKLKEAIAKFKETNSPQFADQILGASATLSKASEKNPEDSTEIVIEEKERDYYALVYEEGRRKTVREIIAENGDTVKERVLVKRTESSILNQHKDLRIVIDDAQISKGGVFSSDHLRFTVKTEPLGWVTYRKHSEFSRLKMVLDKLHPGLMIPNILRKNEKEKFGEESVRKRIYVYERFLNDCLKNEEVKATKFFVDFLSVSDRAKFVPIKKAVENISKITKLDDLSSLTGQIPIDVRRETANHSMLCETYLVQAEPVYKEIKALGKKLAAELNQVYTTVNELSNHYTTLHTISNNFNKKAELGKDQLEQIYAEMPSLIRRWGESFKIQSTAIRKSLVCFNKYSIYESESLKAMNQARIRLQADFETLNKEMLAKKEKLFASKDINKWNADPAKLKAIPKEVLLNNKALAFDLMLEKESIPLRQFKDSYGFLNNETFEESVRVFNSHAETFKSNISDFIGTQIDTLTQMHAYWAGFLTDMKHSVELEVN